MPDVINNTNNRFVPRSHFFAEVNKITQDNTQSFGPVTEDLFRLTSKFTAQAGTKAFAICDGIVAIQPQTGSTDKVNLILRPFKQPIQGFNIRYFVYRGLNRSDFFDAAGNVIAATGTTSDLITKINADFSAFNADEDPLPAFEGAFIGYNTAITDLTVPMDSLFFNLTNEIEVNGELVENPETAFELPKIDFGKSLGTFSSGECGIDVILNYGDYILNEPDRFVFDLNYARAAQAMIDLTGITDGVIRKRRKEQLFQFLDIAAYYGFHCTESGKVVTDSSGAKTEHDYSTIYDLVLLPFATKNTYYLYIQGDRERSYDFYETYRISESSVENMHYGITENTIIPRVYGTNGWPVILESADQEHAEDRNKIYLKLVTDNNINTVLYGQTACVDNAYRNHFSTIDQLKAAPDAEGNQPKLTTVVVLSNPAVAAGPLKKHIANFGILLYQGVAYSYIAGTEVNENNETVNVYAQPNFVDDVFGNLLAEPLLKSEYSNGFSITLNERLLLMNYSNKGMQFGASAILTLKINDKITTDSSEEPYLDRVTFHTEIGDSASDQINPFKRPLQRQTSIVASAQNLSGLREYQLMPPYYLVKESFTDGLNLVNGIRIKTDTAATFSEKVLIGLTLEELQSVLMQLQQFNLVNQRVFLISKTAEGQKYISKELIPYEKFSFGITGENNVNQLQLYVPETPVTIYSLEANCYFSLNYAKYIKNSAPLNLILNHLTKIDSNATI